jgi:hypothetical protein
MNSIVNNSHLNHLSIDVNSDMGSNNLKQIFGLVAPNNDSGFGTLRQDKVQSDLYRPMYKSVDRREWMEEFVST